MLTILEPGPQSPLIGVVRMRAEVVPAVDVRQVEFFVNGVLACTAPAPVPFECVWDAGRNFDPRIVRVVARLTGGGRLVRSMRRAVARRRFSRPERTRPSCRWWWWTGAGVSSKT